MGEQLIASPEPDWPQWRGPRRDGICRRQDLLPEWPEEGPRLLWKFDGLGAGWSSPIVVGPRLYITGDLQEDLVIFALDRQGTLQWQTRNGESWTGPYPGARACCAYSAGRLYHLNAHGRMACLDAASGKELWAVQVLERFGGKEITWGLSECLLVDGPRVVVTPAGGKSLVAALDKQDGRTVWTTAPSDDDRAAHASPILFRHAGRRQIAGCSSVRGFGVDADTGELLWTVPLKNPHGVNAATPVYGSGCGIFCNPLCRGGAALSPAGGRAGPHSAARLDIATGHRDRQRRAGGQHPLRLGLPQMQVVVGRRVEHGAHTRRAEKPDDGSRDPRRRASVCVGRAARSAC